MLVVKDQTTARSIYMQRNLDEKFKSMSNHTHFFRVFFGSVEGTLKIFPGMVLILCKLNQHKLIHQ